MLIAAAIAKLCFCSSALEKSVGRVDATLPAKISGLKFGSLLRFKRGQYFITIYHKLLSRMSNSEKLGRFCDSPSERVFKGL